MPSALHIVSTPIGNLADITYRAVQVLRDADLILAEDTRRARILLDHYEIRTPVAAVHEHNEARSVPKLLERWAEGAQIALISDAGTPLVSDPGARIVEAAIAANVPVIAIPGASALLSALVVAGLPTDRFTFLGFLPRSGADRRQALETIGAATHTFVLYETPPRLADTLADLMAQGAGDRRVVVARELTKKFEEVRRGTAAELAAYYQDDTHTPKGEIVIVVEGGFVKQPDETTIRARAEALRASGMSARDIVTQLVEQDHVPRNLAYRVAHVD